MSLQLINRSNDLKRLQDEGFDIEVRAGYLLVKNVPYVNTKQEVKLGVLVSELSLAGDTTTKPKNHVAHFSGEHPCDKNGALMEKIKHQSKKKVLDEGLVINHSFSSKPKGGYKDHYEKITTYFAIISSPAQANEPIVTSEASLVIEAKDDESAFNYIDTASSRAEINVVSQKLELDKVGIIGLGGTGAYILDLVSKTPVKEIYLFDGDKFSQHNAFRSPGAPSLEKLREEPKKVEYLKEVYSRMHRKIYAQDCYIDGSNIDLLKEMTFVFICIDRGGIKSLIAEKLEELKIPFIDVGMGIQLNDNDQSLCGILRITTSTDDKRDHVRENGRISFGDNEGEEEYSKNIQIADLNALNAALAVIKWKKLYGFYQDFENEFSSTYTIDGNIILNEDRQPS